MMDIIFFVIFIIIFIAIVLTITKKKYIVSPAMFFIYFTFYYPIGLYFAQSQYSGDVPIFFLNRMDLLNEIIFTAIISASFFILFYFTSNNTNKIKFDFLINKKLAVFVFLMLFFPLVIYGNEYGWHALTHYRTIDLSWQTTLYAYVRYTFIVLSLILFASKNTKSKEIFIIFGLNVVVMLIDGARTTFFGLILGYLYIIYRKGYNISFSKNIFIVLLILLLPAIRALVLGGSFINDFIAGITIESTMGGYTAMQAVYATDKVGYIYGASYVLDPIIYMLPKFLRDDLLLFPQHVNFNNLSGEDFSPMGGYYYIGEVYSNFGILGGVIIGAGYGYILKKIENIKPKYVMLSIFFVSTFGATFAKQNFANEFKIFIVYIIIGWFLKKLLIRKV